MTKFPKIRELGLTVWNEGECRDGKYQHSSVCADDLEALLAKGAHGATGVFIEYAKRDTAEGLLGEWLKLREDAHDEMPADFRKLEERARKLLESK